MSREGKSGREAETKRKVRKRKISPKEEEPSKRRTEGEMPLNGNSDIVGGRRRPPGAGGSGKKKKREVARDVPWPPQHVARGILSGGERASEMQP